MSDIPATMTAIEIEAFGPPEGLKAASRPVPTPGDGEVLVRVSHAGVNRPDVQQRLGGYPPPPGASDIPGLEIAGTIVALGPNTGDWKIGDQLGIKFVPLPTVVVMPNIAPRRHRNVYRFPRATRLSKQRA